MNAHISIEDMVNMHKQSGGHFFDPAVMRARSLEIETAPNHKGIFISSSIVEDMRLYTLRLFDIYSAKVYTVNEEHGYLSIEAAKEAIKFI